MKSRKKRIDDRGNPQSVKKEIAYNAKKWCIVYEDKQKHQK